MVRHLCLFLCLAYGIPDTILLAIKNLSVGPTANFILEEARHITQNLALLSEVPAIKKRLYQLMIEISVINEKLRSELALRTELVEDAADLSERLKELQHEDGDYSA